jgi:hypothetical protein
MEGIADGIRSRGAGVGDDMYGTANLQCICQQADLTGGLIEMGEMGEADLGARLSGFDLVIGFTETHGGGTGAKTYGNGFIPM